MHSQCCAGLSLNMTMYGSKEELPYVGCCAMESVVLGGGHLWEMRHRIVECPGVFEVRQSRRSRQGAAAGAVPHGACSELVEVTFDPTQTSHRELIAVCFGRTDATPLNDRKSDVGQRHRMAILCLSDEQRRVAEGAYVSTGASGLWSGNLIW